MSSGERGAKQVKGFFKGIGDVSESVRKNTNSFFDDLVGSKSGTHANTADRDREYTTGHVAGSGVTHDASTGVGTTHSTHGPGSHFSSHNNTTGTGLTDTASTATTDTMNTSNTGIHPDAQKTGQGIGHAIERAGEKIEGSTNHTSTGTGNTYTR